MDSATTEGSLTHAYIGRTYRTRNGELVTIVEDDGCRYYPLRGDNEQWYTRFGALDWDAPSGADLVAEATTRLPDTQPSLGSLLRDPRGYEVVDDQVDEKAVDFDTLFEMNTPPATSYDALRRTFEETVDQCQDIMRRKNHDYTSGSQDVLANFRASEVIDIHVAKGILLRMLDKIKRIQTFAEHGDLQVVGESFDDACHDLINYSILLKHWKVLEDEAN